MELFTIGHSTHSIDYFLSLLSNSSIRVLIDVRTIPFSRYNPQFNRNSLDLTLSQNEIRYIFAGQYLGGKPSDPTCYKSGALPSIGERYLHTVDYRQVMIRPWFVKAIERLLCYASEMPTAIVCSEGNPEDCHRHHLIAKFIMENYPEVDVVHLLPDGTSLPASKIQSTVDGPTHQQLGFGFS